MSHSFIDRFSAGADQILRERPAGRDLAAEFGQRLQAALPHAAHDSSACRDCSLCDLAEQKVAEHLEAPARCLLRQQ
jgi:hypothetical protein